MPPQHALSIVFSVLRQVFVCLRGKCLLLLLLGSVLFNSFQKTLVIKKKTPKIFININNNVCLCAPSTKDLEGGFGDEDEAKLDENEVVYSLG